MKNHRLARRLCHGTIVTPSVSRKWGILAAILLGMGILGSPSAVLAAHHDQVANFPTRSGNPTGSTELVYPSYSVIELGSFGGTNCCLVVTVNNRGWVDGTSNLPGDHNFHPFLWVRGNMMDLGTLGGPNASAGGMNERGDVTVGGSDAGTLDPLGEDACGFGTFQTCRSYVWRDGMRRLVPTLGGNNNDVNTINNRRHVLAFAETAIADPTCKSPQVLGYEAFIWNPSEGNIRRLPPLSGDSTSIGFDMNNHDEAAGLSGACGHALGDPSTARHATLWRHSKPIFLGTLGGTIDNASFSINERGHVVGVSALSGNIVYHAFLWTQDDGMRDLGTLPGDALSIANGINNANQVALSSCDITLNCRAALWQNGAMIDLNALIPPSSPLFLIGANWINASGEIVGNALDRRTGATVPFLAIPREGEYLTRAQVLSRNRRIIQPQRVRNRILQRNGLTRVPWH